MAHNSLPSIIPSLAQVKSGKAPTIIFRYGAIHLAYHTDQVITLFQGNEYYDATLQIYYARVDCCIRGGYG